MVVTVAAFVQTSPVNAQTGFKDLDVSVLKYPAPGYYFIAPNAVDSFSVLDNAGKNMYKTKIGQHANVNPFNYKWFTHFAVVAGKPLYIRRDVNRNAIDTLRPSGDYDTDFHECRIITDTSYLIIGSKQVKMDLSGVAPGGKVDADVILNSIQERTFTGNTLFEWKAIDYIPITDATDDIELDVAMIDYIHINSVIKDVDGNYIISARHLDEVIKINRQTGAIMWRLGGSKSKHNQFRFLNDTTNGFFGFSHQHCVTRSGTGTLLMFDNGNLKPAPVRSRAVEYEIDTVAKTVKRVFEFYPTPDIYATTQGSAQELENGNILVGYGSGSNNTVAHEVSRDGVVQVQINNPTANGFTPYRVLKQAFLMTGAFRRITTTGTTTFTRDDSTTHLSVTWSRVDSATSATAERHSYAPHNVSFTDVSACGILPTRWVFRIKDTAKVAGTMTFDVGSVPGIEFPDQVELYHRGVEGQGDFSLVTTSYSAATKKLSVGKLLPGEFLIGYPKCFAPSLIEPLNFATEVIPAPKLQWTGAVTTGEYQVELSPVNTFLTVYARFSTRRLDTTLASVPEFSKLYWRVRAKRTVGYGPWSEVFQFTTQLSVPTIITPIAKVKDTVAVLPTHVFTWSKIKGAQRYRVVITGFGSPIVAVDTLVDSASFVVGTKLFPNSKFTWNVRALSDTIVGRVSATAFFITAPPAPRLVTPPNDATEIATDRPVFVWEEVPGALRYIVTVKRLLDSTVVARDSSIRPPLTIAALPTATRCSWTCKAVGKYGPGPDASTTTFTTTATTVLAAPNTISPRKTGNVDTLAVRFTWTGVPMATFYDLQITSKQSFTGPDVELFGLTETNWEMPVLKPGTTYGWRVIGYNGTAAGRWSDTASFTTRASPSQGLTPISPVSGSTDVPLAGVFTYSTASKYTSYDVLVAEDPSFTTPEFRFTSSTGTCAYSGFKGGTTYFWRAVGKKAGQPNEFGSPATFTTLTVTSVAETESTKSAVVAYMTGNSIVVAQSEKSPVYSNACLYTVQGHLVQVFDASALATGHLSVPSLATGAYYLMLESANSKPLVLPLLNLAPNN
ncbi:MAG: aryl-sulfate sulfotransferase [Candidatus Kapabacteria bacterium]|nr:aryl-sulfate sulfotransferase [Candidatus Kapabacteria bacterium]